MDVADSTIDSGEYQISYSMDVLFDENVSGATLVCGLRPANGTITHFEPDSRTRVRSSGSVQHLEFSGPYAVPELSFGLRCHPTLAGHVTAHFSNITLTVTPH